MSQDLRCDRSAMLYRPRAGHAIYIATEATYHGHRYDWDGERRGKGIKCEDWTGLADGALSVSAFRLCRSRQKNARMRRSLATQVHFSD